MLDDAIDTKRRIKLGEIGEEVAANWLAARDAVIIERNFRNGKSGEIDIIAQIDAELVFIEVKSRRLDCDFSAIEHTGQMAVDRRKRQKIREAAFAFCRLNRERALSSGSLNMRFDVILVDLRLSLQALRAYLAEDDFAAIAKACRVRHLPSIF